MNKLLFCCTLVCCFIIAAYAQTYCSPVPGTPPNTPMGKARGINPGRVTWSFHPEATSWDGSSLFWFNESNVNYDIVRQMVTDSLLGLTGEQTEKAAWNALFTFFNMEKRGVKRGYIQGEKVAMKINLNTIVGKYQDNNGNSLSPQGLRAVLDSLTNQGGVPQDSLFVYDASRCIPPYLFDGPTGVHPLFPGVHFVDNLGKQGRELAQPDPDTLFLFSDTAVPNFDLTQLPTIVTQASYMVVLDNFRGHDLAGVTLSGKNFFGSINRPCCPDPYCGQMIKGQCICGVPGKWCPASLHWFVNRSNPMGSYSPLVDLLGHDKLGGNAVVFLSDALYSGPTEQPFNSPVLFQSSPFNNHWSSSFFASQDPIALDSVAFDILRNEPSEPYASDGCVDNYLHEAALSPRPSTTVYNPTGKNPLGSLGVHEHWNNPNDKQYTRNLGTGKGIELVHV